MDISQESENGEEDNLQVTTIELGVTDPINDEKERLNEPNEMSTSYEIVPAEWRRDEGGNISVHIMNSQQTSAQQNLECEKSSSTSNYTINSFLTKKVSEQTNINRLQVEDNNRKPREDFIPNITDVFFKFKHLISLKRSFVQSITSYIREFEDRVIDLESSGLVIDQMLLAFFLLIGSQLPDSKVDNFLPVLKPDGQRDLSCQGEFVYDQLITNLVEVHQDLIANQDTKENVRHMNQETNKETPIRIGETFSMEDTTKCIMNAATSLSDAHKAIKLTLKQDSISAGTRSKLQEPLERATKALQDASKSLSRFSMVYTEGEERYRMVLKRRELKDNEFVMKIEPEIENSLQEQEELNRSAATEENNLEDILDNDLAVENEDVNDNNDKQALISKGKPLKGLKRLKKLKRTDRDPKERKKLRRQKFEAEEGASSVVIRDDGKKVYPCCECEYVAGDFYRLRRHQNSVHLGIKFPCDQCDFAASDSSGLTRHKKSKHEGYRYVCTECDYAATTASDLKRHSKSRHEGIRYPCDLCDYSATQVSNLTQHKKSKHEGVRYLCDQCPYAATAPSDLTRHKKCKHQSVYQCDSCDFVINNPLKLKHHKKRHHDGYSCDLCDFVTPIRNNLRYHKRSKHDGSKFLCDQCEYSTINSSNLLRHKRSNHAVEMDKKSLVASVVIKGDKESMEYLQDPLDTKPTVLQYQTIFIGGTRDDQLKESGQLSTHTLLHPHPSNYQQNTPLGTAGTSQPRTNSRQINQYSGGAGNGRSPATEDKQQTNSAANGLVGAGMSHFFSAKPPPYNPYL